MDTQTRERLQHALQEELTLVERSLAEAGAQVGEGEWSARPEGVDQTATEADEVADRIESYEENREEVAVLQKQWQNITRALEKMKQGTYGTCEVSGEPIEAARLEANPSARTCAAHLNHEEGLPL